MAILAPLRELDQIAYLRFASVYRSFSTLEDFEGEIALLRAAPSNTANSQAVAKDLKSETNASSNQKTLVN
jgi:transcriptional repressor NrdR